MYTVHIVVDNYSEEYYVQENEFSEKVSRKLNLHLITPPSNAAILCPEGCTIDHGHVPIPSNPGRVAIKVGDDPDALWILYNEYGFGKTESLKFQAVDLGERLVCIKNSINDTGIYHKINQATKIIDVYGLLQYQGKVFVKPLVVGNYNVIEIHGERYAEVKNIDLSPIFEIHDIASPIYFLNTLEIAQIRRKKITGSSFLQAEFIDQGNISWLIEHIAECRKAFFGGLIVSPYFAITQSSGSGKTRLILETAARIPILFINCLSIQGRMEFSGFETLMEAIDLDLCTIDHGKSRIEWLLEYDELAKKLPEADLSTKVAMTQIYARLRPYNTLRVVQKMYLWFFQLVRQVYESQTFDKNGCKELQLLAHDLFHGNELGWPEFENGETMQQIKQSTLGGENWLGSVDFVFVFDEARTIFGHLLPPDISNRKKIIQHGLRLRMLRRAFSEFAAENKLNLSFILIDTTLTLNNFAPPNHLISSSRDSKRILFPPFILHFQDPLVSDYVSKTKRLSGLEFYAHIFDRNGTREDDDFLYLGRPLWKACRLQGEILMRIINRAKDFLQSRDSFSNWLAILAARVTLQINPFSKISSELLETNLAVLLATNKARDGIYVTYLSEPIVAAAASILRSEKKYELEGFLQKLAEHEAANVGHRGEYVLQMVALDVIDHLTGSKPYISVRVGEFLDAFLGSSWRDVLLPEERVLNGRICLSQFKYFDYVPTKDTLCEALIRGLGIVPKENNHGYDLIIPFITTDGIVSGIFVEVRNRAGQADFNDKIDTFTTAVRKILSQEALNTAVCIFLNLKRGDQDAPMDLRIIRRSPFAILTVSNFSRSPFMKEEYLSLISCPTTLSNTVQLLESSLNTVRSSYHGPIGLLDLSLTSSDPSDIGTEEAVPDEPLKDGGDPSTSASLSQPTPSRPVTRSILKRRRT